MSIIKKLTLLFHKLAWDIRWLIVMEAYSMELADDNYLISNKCDCNIFLVKIPTSMDKSSPTLFCKNKFKNADTYSHHIYFVEHGINGPLPGNMVPLWLSQSKLWNPIIH